MPRRPERRRARDRRAAAAPAPVNAAGPWVGRAASLAVVLCAFVVGFHKIDDFDTWWHLAAGRWIATHGAIPATDTLSHTVRDHAWINPQWGFDLGLYLIHEWGGAMLLCAAGALLFAAAVALIQHLVVGHLGHGLGGIAVLLVVLAAQERATVRPELLSLVLLAGVHLVLDRGRRLDGQGLVLLVPLMIVWANVHALFVIGAFAIACAFVGTGGRPSRRLLIWGGAALAAVLVNPFGMDGALFPLKLWTRLDGSSPVFQTIGEFGSPFAAGASGVSVVAYKTLLAIGGLAAIAALFGRRRRRPTAGSGARELLFDWGGLIFFVGLAVLSATARRNAALFALGSAPFVARCVEATLSSRPRLRAWSARRASVAAAAAMIGAAVLSAAVVTGAFYRFDNAPQEFGAGVIEGTFPVRAAAFARAAALPGKLYNDMSAGGYLAWDDPLGDGVFVDGRLEVYDTAFLTDYVTALSDDTRWQADADRFGIQTAIVFHRFENERMLTGRLARDTRWSLAYADEVAAVFVRTEGNGAALARAASIRAKWDAETHAWLSRPIDRRPYPSGRVEGTRAYARFLATIGRAEPAVEAYLKLVELGIPAKEEIERRLLVARYFASAGRLLEAQEQTRRILAIDPGNLEAQRLK